MSLFVIYSVSLGVGILVGKLAYPYIGQDATQALGMGTMVVLVVLLLSLAITKTSLFD